MKEKTIAAALAGTVGVLASASTALGAYTPRFVVTHRPHSVTSPSTTISIAVPRDDDATAKVIFYAPLGYQGVVGQAFGTQLGTVAATVQAKAISADAILPLQGTIVTDDPARYVANPCAPGLHRGVWVLGLEAAGRTLQVPVYLDVPTGGEASFATFKFQTCLPSPDVPESAGGAAFGAKLLTAVLQLNRGLMTAPATLGQYVWPAFFTPYAAGTGAPNVGGTVQSRGIARLPGQVTLAARALRRGNRYEVSGLVTENRLGVAGATIEVFKGPKTNRLARVAQTRTSMSGRFASSGRLQPRLRSYFRVRAVVPNRLNTTVGCSIAVPNLPIAPGGCVTATYAGFTTQSRIASLRVLRR